MASGLIKFDSKLMSRSITTLDSITQVTHHNHQTNSANFLNPESYKNAPEIAHLKINRRANDDKAEGSIQYEEPSTVCCGCRCKGCCGVIISKCSNCGRREYGDTLDDLDPIAPRTRNSLEFLRRLTESKSNKSVPNSQKGPMSSETSIKRAYRAAFEGLNFLHEANDIFKQLIILLSFTRYAEEPLTVQEMHLTHAKTILGSYAWMTTYSLQQLQFDPDVEINGYPALELKQVIRTMETLVCQTVYMWEAMVHTIETVELVHKKAEHVFSTLMNSFPETKDSKITTTRHIKVYRKHERRTEELEKLKQYDPHKVAQTWTRYSNAPLRILYKPGKATLDPWTGFDLLSTLRKFSILKMLQTDMNEICSTVLDHLQKIDKLLHRRSNNKEPSAAVKCFEDGFIVLGHILQQLPTSSWSPQEINDFLEVDKITLDGLDLLTLGTATVRTLLHEARHILHVTYETSRDFDYLECKVMNTYEEIVSNCRNDFENWEAGIRSTPASLPKRSSSDKKKQSVYDVEEFDLERRDAEVRFERSVYQDILKELPVFCNKEQVALTLQDPEGVFTDSSHDMLSVQPNV